MAPLRASLARSPPRLGRSQAGGLHPQTPRAAPPGAPSRTGPLLPQSPSRRGSGHGCDGGGGGQPLAVVHARRLAPGGFRASGEIQKMVGWLGGGHVGNPAGLSTCPPAGHRGVWGACPPGQWRRWSAEAPRSGCPHLWGQLGCPRLERCIRDAFERDLRAGVFPDSAETQYWRGFQGTFQCFSWDHF